MLVAKKIRRKGFFRDGEDDDDEENPLVSTTKTVHSIFNSQTTPKKAKDAATTILTEYAPPQSMAGILFPSCVDMLIFDWKTLERKKEGDISMIDAFPTRTDLKNGLEFNWWTFPVLRLG